MDKTFVKKGELSLENGGYLMVGDKPVGNKEFIEAQKEAEYIVTFAGVAKDADLKGKEAVTLEELNKKTREILEKKDITYIDAPKKPKSEITDKMKKEALSFIEHFKIKENTQKLNKYMQKFNVIYDFENFGLYFDHSINKLDKIYTIEEIRKALESSSKLILDRK